MLLNEIIDQYKDAIAGSRAVRGPDGGEGYKAFSTGFGGEVVKLPLFTYSRDDMEATVLHLESLGITDDLSISKVVGYAMRRAAMEKLPDTPARHAVWRLMELTFLRIFENDEREFITAVRGYAMQTGKGRVEQYAKAVLDGFNSFYEGINKARFRDNLSPHTAAVHNISIKDQRSLLEQILGFIDKMQFGSEN